MYLATYVPNEIEDKKKKKKSKKGEDAQETEPIAEKTDVDPPVLTATSENDGETKESKKEKKSKEKKDKKDKSKKDKSRVAA